MAVYLPTAAVGNGRVLCTLGGAGEIMGFFYPHIDFAQNVHQLMSGLYLGDPGHGRFLWTFQSEFQRHQQYLPGTNILRTTLRLPTEGLTLVFSDFCPPGTTALVRRVRVGAEYGFRGTFMMYFALRLNEVVGKQSVRHIPEAGLTLQWFRDIAIAVAGARPSVWRCGKSIDEGPRSAKHDMLDGHLNGQAEDIGQVDFALGWHIKLGAGEATEFDVILAAGRSREEATANAQTLSQVGGAELESQVAQDGRLWLEGLRRPARLSETSPRLAQAYDRALLSLAMLQDEQTHAIIAAPEFDPTYELCGGYGYCWPRDATEAAMALKLAGAPEALSRLVRWYLGSQLPSGQWGQRYWSNGMLASSWALREDFLQVDQTAAALIALCEAAQSGYPPDSEAALHPSTLWPAVRRAASALQAMVGEDGWHSFACDLWETFCGSFVYTNAAIYAALRRAARLALVMAEPSLVVAWEATARRIKEATIAVHNGQHFPRGVFADRRPDLLVDSSTMGVSEPFGMLSPDIPEERRLIETNLFTIEQRLNYRLPDGGVGIRRYEGDGYLGGVIGCVNTLWFALVSLQLSNSYRGQDDQRAAELRAKAQNYIDFCLEHTTPTGLLPELIGTSPQYPYWAAPHGWASALLVKCVLELEDGGGVS